MLYLLEYLSFISCWIKENVYGYAFHTEAFRGFFCTYWHGPRSIYEKSVIFLDSFNVIFLHSVCRSYWFFHYVLKVKEHGDLLLVV